MRDAWAENDSAVDILLLLQSDESPNRHADDALCTSNTILIRSQIANNWQYTNNA